VAFGSGHTINSQGIVSATGPLGIAARFDMGAIYNDVALASYGEYYDAEGEEQGIGGPAVVAFNLSGPLLGGQSDASGQWLSGVEENFGGRRIALYIGPNTHVAAINILDGAVIQGDIISRWDPGAQPYIPTGTPTSTSLTFGLAKKSDGTADIGTPDPSFELSYQGNITGPETLEVSLEGGTLRYAGSIDALSFSAASGTTIIADLSGGMPLNVSAYTINLDPSLQIGFEPAPFSYGRELPVGEAPLVVFDARDGSTFSAPIPIQGQGAFSVGPYDYTWQGLSYADGTVSMGTSSRGFNHQRGATDAQNAPLAVAYRNPGLSAVTDRISWRFSSGAPNSSTMASALLGSVREGGAGSLSGGAWNRLGRHRLLERLSAYQAGPVVAGDHVSEADRVAAREPGAYAGWLPFGDAGWESFAGRTGLWVAPSYGLTEHSGSRDYRIRGASVTMGLDFQPTNSLFLGFAVSLDYPRYTSSDAQVRGRGASAYLYGGVRLPLELELGMSASMGGMRFTQTRQVQGETIHGRYSGDTAGAGISLGRRFTVSDDVILRPFASFDVFSFERSANTETGGIYALGYESTGNTLRRVRAGADLAFAFERGYLSARAWWSGLRGSTTERALASFAMDPDRNIFAAPVDGLDRNQLGLAMNAGYRLGDSVELAVEYSFTGGGKTKSHQGMVGLELSF
jgi:hypothetical protein